MNTKLFMPVTTNLLVPLLMSTYDVVMPLFFAYLGLFYLLFGRGGREALVYNVFHLVGSLLVGRLFPRPRVKGERSFHLAILTMMALFYEIMPWSGSEWNYLYQNAIIVSNCIFLNLEDASDGIKSLVNFTHLLLLLRFHLHYKLFTVVYILYPLILNIWFDSFPNKLSISP